MYAVYLDTHETVEVTDIKSQSDGRVLYEIQFLDGWREGHLIYVDEHQIEIDGST